MPLEQLAVDLGDEITSHQARPEFLGEFRENIFTSLRLEELSGAGVIEAGEVCYAEKRIKGAMVRVHGYSVPESEDRLDLFITLFTEDGAKKMVETSREEASKAIEQAWRFYDAVVTGKLTRVEASSSEHGMVRRIEGIRSQLTSIRIFLLTNTKVVNVDRVVQMAEADHPEIKVEVWDLERINRVRESGTAFDVIEVDFGGELGSALPCLPLATSSDEYRGFLTIIPGEVLKRVYERFGDRLLELNVRCFLQARGKVNKGIRDTLLNEPESFFAYNNGLSMVAEEVRLSEDGSRIIWARGLQIVNGGQTTASIHRAGMKDGADLSKVFIQAKLSVVPPHRLEAVVPLISRNANSQNKVNDADFSANDPLHRSIEERSRSTWGPGEKSKWFYERARGQYQEARRRASKGATALKKFDAEFPASQVFSKTDYAASENTWDGNPHLVSLGGQKNFLRFVLEHGKNAEIDAEEFCKIVARLLLYRATVAIVREEAFPAYRANIVTYTEAYVVDRLGDRVGLESIWKAQGVSPELRECLRSVARVVDREIKSSAGDKNVTEWCKKEACWEHIKKLSIPLPTTVWPAKRSKKAQEGRESPTWMADLLRQQVEVIPQDDGTVWVLGSGSIAARVKAAAASGGFSLRFAHSGGPPTNGRPAWVLTPVGA